MPFTYCTNCGAKVDDSEERCPKCGHPISAFAAKYQDDLNKTAGENPQNNNQNQQTPPENNGENSPFGNMSDDSPYNTPNNQQPNGNPYGQPNGNPYGQPNGNPYGQPNGNPYGQPNGNPYGQPNGNPNGQPYGNPYGQTGFRPVVLPPKRDISIGLLIFSIVNIVVFGGCCTGLIFGIIGLVYTIAARDARTDEEEASKKKTALIMNIIGVATSVIFVVFFTLAMILSSNGVMFG